MNLKEICPRLHVNPPEILTIDKLFEEVYNEHVKQLIGEDSIKQSIQKASKETNTKPSEAQIEAENYKKGKCIVNGFKIAIEQPKGSIRSGIDDNGKEWSIKMNNPYGYFITYGTKTVRNAIDGDKVDVFLGTKYDSKKIFVIDQYVNGKFDESKVFLLVDSKEEVKSEYLKNYEKGWKGCKYITEVDEETFKKWLYSSQKQRKPFHQYSLLKEEEGYEDYVGDHSAPGVEQNCPLYDLTLNNVYPSDIYSSQQKHLYSTYENVVDSECFSTINFCRNKPNQVVSIYRAVPNLNFEVDKKLKDLNNNLIYFNRFNFFEKKSTGDKMMAKYYDDSVGYYLGYGETFQKVVAEIEEEIGKLEAKKTKLKINSGDWVTISLEYAKMHGKANFKKYKIISKKVKAKNVWTNGDNIAEWGYWS
jgi:hypothetical protein